MRYMQHFTESYTTFGTLEKKTGLKVILYANDVLILMKTTRLIPKSLFISVVLTMRQAKHLFDGGFLTGRLEEIGTEVKNKTTK